MANEDPARRPGLAGLLLVPGLILAGLIGIALLVIMFGDEMTGTDTQEARKERISPALLARFRNQYDARGVAAGAADAPVTVREFADYQCPACKAFQPTAERIRETYVESGQVRFVFFDMPLPMHQHAQQAAVAARCAGRADAYWRYHDKLFATQRTWANAGDPTGHFLDLAVESGIRVEPFRACLRHDAAEQAVSASAQVGRQVGVASTPTVMVGDRVFAGVTGFDTLKAEIERQLAAGGAEQPAPQPGGQ